MAARGITHQRRLVTTAGGVVSWLWLVVTGIHFRASRGFIHRELIVGLVCWPPYFLGLLSQKLEQPLETVERLVLR